MCGHGRKAARHHGRHERHGRQMNPYTDQAGASGIAAIVGAFQEIKLAGHGIDSRARPGEPRSFQEQKVGSQVPDVERGVVYDLPVDEKKERVEFEELPTYEQVSQPQPRIFTPTPATYQDVPQPQLQRSASQVVILDNLESFRESLLAYRQGDWGAKKDAKHAAKRYIMDLYDQERARRSAGNGRLQCGERKEIKRNLKPIKQTLKAAVWEAKRERRERH